MWPMWSVSSQAATVVSVAGSAARTSGRYDRRHRGDRTTAPVVGVVEPGRDRVRQRGGSDARPALPRGPRRGPRVARRPVRLTRGS